MQLTGKEIIEKGIIQNHCEEGIQQQGIDVRVDYIKRVGPYGEYGVIPAQGKTVLPTYNEVPQMTTWRHSTSCTWLLEPGYYEVTLMEGCNIPSNVTLHFKTRSSLVRCGALVHSGQFDAGFETGAMGCFLQVLVPISIERGARIAQAICFESREVDNLYDGQWQGDKQREPK